MKRLPHPWILPWFLTTIFTLVSFSTSQVQQGPARLHFIFNATEFPSEEFFDYIVVGGGTAGCPLAATLSVNNRVLVLERGGLPDEHPNLLTENGFLPALTSFDLHNSPAQSFTSADGVPNARGRVLGGSSAINAGFYSRAEPHFFGRTGIKWNIRAVNESYDWVERAIVFQPELKNWQAAVRDGLLEAGVEPYNGFTYDHLIGTKIGGSTFDRSGRRHSAADLLGYAKSSNIRVALYASVERILLSGSSETYTTSGARQSVIGVMYRDRMGRQHHAMLRGKGEVILSAGALGSPQLLLLSGIGPRRYLYSWGIRAEHHSPFVGQFLFDNPRNGISIVPPMPLQHSLIQVVGITDSGVFIEAASNVISFPSPTHSVFVRASSSPLNLTVATLMTKIVGPLSVGSLRLASKDVRTNPSVRFNYFTHPRDLQRCVNGLRRIALLLSSRAMNDFKFDDWSGGRDFRYVGQGLPFDLSSDEVMGDYCRRTVSTIWHYHGGCVVGRVVDHDFKVKGVDALRVVDGSIFPVSPGTNPQATIMMLGRYVGMKILRERMRPRYPLDDVERMRPRYPLDDVERVRPRYPLDDVERVRPRYPVDDAERLVMPRPHPVEEDFVPPRVEADCLPDDLSCQFSSNDFK